MANVSVKLSYLHIWWLVLLNCYNVGLHYISGFTALLDTVRRGSEFHTFLVVCRKLFPNIFAECLGLVLVSTVCHVYVSMGCLAAVPEKVVYCSGLSSLVVCPDSCLFY